MNIIETEALTYAGVLHYPPLRIKEGAVTFLTGDSGSGKTTLLRLINATLSPEYGHIFYRGEDTRLSDPLELRRKVLLTGQSVFLFDTTIRDNFHMYYEYRDLPTPSDELIDRYLSLCMAPFALDSSCNTLSGGERQRVYLAIFLSFGADTLLLDEPTSALDRHLSDSVFSNIVSFAKNSGTTLVVVSHDTELVKKHAEFELNLTNEVRR